MSKKIGFIGQGFIGKNYANDFENRGHDVIRYALEEPYVKNKEKIKDCDIVFIAVPTPTTPEGFDDSILREAVGLVKDGATVVIKSTILPGRTESIQEQYPNKFVMHSPEFLTEVTAAHDAANPDRNIIGVPKMEDEYLERANEVMGILPKAAYEDVVHAKEAEMIKYGGNIWFYFKVIFVNMLYDIAKEHGADYDKIKNAMAADYRIGSTHLDPIHKSGRGAGGHCFIKDFAAFTEHYNKYVGNEHGSNILEHLKKKNIHLLTQSKKDLELLTGVYGEAILESMEAQEEIADEIEKIDEVIGNIETSGAAA